MSNNNLIPLDDASVIAAPSSPNATFSDPTSVLHNRTWLLAENEPGYWTASFGFTFTPARLRLWNSDVDDSGIEAFSLTPLSTSGLSNLSFVDPGTLENAFCSSSCPLSMSPSTGYQDFHFVNVISMNAFRLDINTWYGSEGGFRGIQLYGDFQASSTPSTLSTSFSSASSTSALIPTSPTAPISTNTTPPQSDTSLSGGAIAGIVIVTIAAASIAMASFIFWRRYSRRTQQLDEKFIPLGGRHEVDDNGISRAKYRGELDGHVVSELDVTPARQELEANAVYEFPGDKSPK